MGNVNMLYFIYAIDKLRNLDGFYLIVIPVMMVMIMVIYWERLYGKFLGFLELNIF